MAKKSSVKNALSLFLNIDIFGKPVPSFNLEGKDTIKTTIGACMTLIMLILTLAFGLLKMRHLFERKNPIINTN